MTQRLIFLAVLFLLPTWAFAAAPVAAGSPPAAWLAVATSPAAPAAAPDLAAWPAWLAGPDQPQAASSCGSNFCTAAQRQQCADSCHTHIFVGLQCCSDCTTICNCGSRPINC